jgi:tRNA(Leu) C34 or U34 (ribose-2'-O)-methylase TrmL
MRPNVWVALHLEDWSLHWVNGQMIDMDVWRETAAWWGAVGLIVVHNFEFVTLKNTDDILPMMQIREYKAIQEAQLDFQEPYQWVWMDPKGETSLADLKHPETNVVYAFGPDGNGFEPNHVADGIRIPSVKDVGSLWSVAAMQVTLYDRMVKLQ